MQNFAFFHFVILNKQSELESKKFYGKRFVKWLASSFQGYVSATARDKTFFLDKYRRDEDKFSTSLAASRCRSDDSCLKKH